MDPRETKLPVWAQELLADLRRRVQYGNEPVLREIAHLRPQVELFKRKNEALTELLECAARGWHKDAQAIVEILEMYDLVLKPKQN